MNLKITLLTLFGLLFVSLDAQIKSVNIPIKDDIEKYSVTDPSDNKRSAQYPAQCASDTVEYPRYKATNLVTISVSKGRSLGQLYSCPKPLTLSGFTFYGFIISNPPTSKKMNIICNVYKAGTDSLPSGSPLRSDTLLIDSTIGGGLLSKIIKRATWSPITLDSAYILTVETDDDSLVAAVVTNNYSLGDGDDENLNCGSISGLWYNGKNLNVNGTPFDCDILLHPYVSYKFGTDFSVKPQCYNSNDTVKFTNMASQNMAGSKMYNRYMTFNLGDFCHYWDYGNGMGGQYIVDGKVKYPSKQNATVTLYSTVYGYNGSMFGGCDDTVSRFVTFKPDMPSYIGSVNVCIGDTAKLTAVSNNPGVNFEWFEPGNPTPFLQGATYTQFPITSNDTFFLRASNGSCISTMRSIILRANAYPSNLTTTNDSVCAGSKANLKASSSVGNLNWFTQLSGGLPFYTGANYQTNVLMKDTFYYVEANNLGCILSPRVRVNALVGSNFAPTSPVLSNDTLVCLGAGGSVMLNAIAGAGLTVRWFNEAGTFLSNGPSYTFNPVIREVKTFYADAYNGVCGSTKEPVVITVEHYPDLSAFATDTICNGDSADISCQVPYGVIEWYDSASGGNLLGVGTELNVKPNASRFYYVQTSSNICVNPNRDLIPVTVNDFPAFTKLWGDTICSKNTALLRAETNGPGSVRWYEYDTSTVELATGNSYVTQVLNGGKRYYARTDYAGCIGPMVLVQPTVKNSPFSGFIFDVLTWQQVRVTPINSAGSSVFWDFGDGFTSTKYSLTHRYDDIGQYDIKLVLTSLSNACKDSTTVTVDIAESSLAAIDNLPDLSMYPNPADDKLYIELPDLNQTLLVTVYDMKGSKMDVPVNNQDSNKLGLDVSELNAGMYLLVVNGYKPVIFVKE